MELTASAATLKTYINEGLLPDVIQAREAYALLRKLGDNSAAIVASTYSNFFDALDRALLAQYLLAIARLYDRPSTQYEIRSIPAAAAFIRRQVEQFPVLERRALEHRLLNAGLEPTALQDLTDLQITDVTLRFFESRMPSAAAETRDALSMAIRAVRARRDKRLAHSEHTSSEVFPNVTWDQAESLVRFAEDFLGCIAFGYMRYALSDDDGRFMLEGDAARAARALGRLLAAAKITQPPERPAA